jgi:hypothetical protein
MKIVSNPKKIERNYKIGLYTSLGSLAFLVGAVILTFTGLSRPDLTLYSFIAMVIGLILSPRVDERITQGLKGLDERYTLYHYSTPIPHLLVGPAGVWVIAPQYHSGTVTYEKNRYRQHGVSFFSRVVGQESLGRPDLEASSYQEDLQKFLKKSLPETGQPNVRTVIVFTNPKATVQAQDAPIPTLHVDKLKDFVRRKAKEEPPSLQSVRQVQDLLPKEDI